MSAPTNHSEQTVAGGTQPAGEGNGTAAAATSGAATTSATATATPSSKPLAAKKGLVAGLIGLAIVIAAFPMFFNFHDDSSGEEAFGGTDSGAEAVVEEQDPGYTPWFEPLVGELPGEVESGLFALQAALGAGVLGYVIGIYRGRSKAEEAQRLAAVTPRDIPTAR